MNNFIIFNMQVIAGLLTFYFAFKWFVFPKLGVVNVISHFYIFYRLLKPNPVVSTDS